ncbi:membrane protein [Mycobacterium tuberculosis M1374]|nr:membrane protein [Mycobacterium tuberculosis M1374]KCP06070.1 membrane protein [Mycobacterium tuberculosis BTB09-036]
MSFCVYCGAELADPTRCGACGAYKIGSTWHRTTTPTVGAATTATGWRPDPTGRHEGRYFVAGQPTDLVREGDAEAVDPLGQQQLDQSGAVGVSPSAVSGWVRSGHRRLWWALAGVVAFLGLVGAGVVGTLFLNRDRESIDDKYLAALRRSGLTGEFNSDANAIARGKQVCRQLQDGGEQQGMPVDQVAVQYYCPQFSDGFHILETITVTGSFTLKDESPNVYAPAITVSGSGCSGSAGYADIDRGTQVTVKNG